MKSRLLLLALTLSLALAAHAQSTVNFALRMWNTGIVEMWDGTQFEFYGFSRGLTYPTLPGPTLVVNEGDSVILNVRNSSQGSHHTVHLHGLDVDQANDGTPHTSFAIEHGRDTNYYFVANHAGTYLYHCHVLSVWHIQLGMYGSIIVRAAGAARQVWTGGPSFDRDYLWLFSEIDKNWFDSIPIQHSEDSTFETIPIRNYAPEYYLVNGKSETGLADSNTTIYGMAGERIHLRLGNMGYFENQVVFPPSLNAQVVARDGRPRPQAVAAATLLVRPGERYSVLFDMDPNLPSSTIDITWRDMNNHDAWNTQQVPVYLSTGISIPEPTPSTPINLTAYPQPAHDIVWVQTSRPLPKASTYTISTLDGKVLHTGHIGAAQSMFTLDLEHLPSGLYALQIHSGETIALTRIAIHH